MNKFRKSLVDRMIRKYGFKNPVVIDFYKMCKTFTGADQTLRFLVEAHEAYVPKKEDY